MRGFNKTSMRFLAYFFFLQIKNHKNTFKYAYFQVVYFWTLSVCIFFFCFFNAMPNLIVCIFTLLNKIIPTKIVLGKWNLCKFQWLLQTARNRNFKTVTNMGRCLLCRNKNQTTGKCDNGDFNLTHIPLIYLHFLMHAKRNLN